MNRLLPAVLFVVGVVLLLATWLLTAAADLDWPIVVSTPGTLLILAGLLSDPAS